MARCVYNRNANEYKVNLFVFVGYVHKRGKKRKREKKKTKKRTRLSKIQRERVSKLEQAGRKSKFKEASHLPISPVRNQLW